MLMQTQTVSCAASFKHPVADNRLTAPAARNRPIPSTHGVCVHAVCAQ